MREILLYRILFVSILVCLPFFSSGCSDEREPVGSDSNLPPDQPVVDVASGAPGHGSMIQGNSVQLQWTCSDPDGDPLVYDVYFDTVSDPEQQTSSQIESSYSPGELASDTRHYWRIVAWDDHNQSTDSPVWSFTTLPDDITVPSILSANPADGSQDVPLDLPYIVVNFSEPMEVNSLVTHLDADGSTISLPSIDWDVDNTQAAFILIDSLEPSEEYRFTIVEGQSTEGIDLSPLPYTLQFSTESVVSFSLIYTSLEDRPRPFFEVPVDSPIVLLFNEEVDLLHPESFVEVRDVTEGESWLLDATVLSQDCEVTISFPYPLEWSRDYRICYHLVGSISSTSQDSCLFFQTELDTDFWYRVRFFSIDMGEGWRADWNTNEISFKWQIASRALGYKLYARDNFTNTDFIEIADVPSSNDSPWMTATATLPQQFDRYLADGIQTPFTGGTVVEFDIRAYNIIGLGPFSDNISIADETPPGSGDSEDGGNDIIVVYQSWGSGDNSASAIEDTVWISLSEQIEYVDQSCPVIEFVEAGGDPNFVLPDSAVFWIWRDDGRFNQYTGADATGAGIVIPPYKNASGDSLYLGFKDNSGNDTTVVICIEP